MKDEYSRRNYDIWQKWADINSRSEPYAAAIERIYENGTSLYPMELKALGDVKGKRMIHLQCHLGMDSISWQLEGASVVGIDFSEKAIKMAIDLNKKLGTHVDFYCYNVYDLPEKFNAAFDIVFCSYGIIGWLDNLDKWCGIIHRLLKKAGIFYIIDFHPLLNILDDSATVIEQSYFNIQNAILKKRVGSYADKQIDSQDNYFYNWHYSISHIIESFVNNDMEIVAFKEFPFSIYEHRFDTMKQTDDGFWTAGDGKIPMLFSIKAIKK